MKIEYSYDNSDETTGTSKPAEQTDETKISKQNTTSDGDVKSINFEIDKYEDSSFKVEHKVYKLA